MRYAAYLYFNTVPLLDLVLSHQPSLLGRRAVEHGDEVLHNVHLRGCLQQDEVLGHLMPDRPPIYPTSLKQRVHDSRGGQLLPAGATASRSKTTRACPDCRLAVCLFVLFNTIEYFRTRQRR